KAQQLFRTDAAPQPDYDEILELDLNSIQPVVAGPKRPFDLITVQGMAQEFPSSLSAPGGHHGFGLTQEDTTKEYVVEMEGRQFNLKHGSVIMAAITSCTNTSNPAVLMGAGLLAKKAVEKGLHVEPYIKTSLTPGSLVVDMYLINSGLMPYLSELGFQVAGHACATCIGNSGPLPEPINRAVNKGLVGTAVISGNRNFEGRIHKSVKACYLASPLLVVAYALAGTVDIDFTTTPLGKDQKGTPVFLADIWPSQTEIDEYLKQVDGSLFAHIYTRGLTGNQFWQALEEQHGMVYDWDSRSSYLREPPFILEHFDTRQDILKARVLAKLGDSITTDHISPAGKIQVDSDCGRYLGTLGCDPNDLNTYGARRGNHEAMLRGTFSNPRLKNELVNGKSGDLTRYLPQDKEMSIFEASRLYQKEHIPLIILAGKQYGTGSSRDWAAKGPFLLGVRAVLAESYERIHRSNLVMMGILPLQFLPGESAAKLGLDGSEKYSVHGLGNLNRPGQTVNVQIESEDGKVREIQSSARLDTPVEVHYFKNGGILPAIFNDLSAEVKSAEA
ncbi:MAG: aconitate hydratase AcnA, partial [Chloroflexi bacterium]|nr:aconitate hydratase AcnA [Chloroflexota bacterium]